MKFMNEEQYQTVDLTDVVESVQMLTKEYHKLQSRYYELQSKVALQDEIIRRMQASGIVNDERLDLVLDKINTVIDILCGEDEPEHPFDREDFDEIRDTNIHPVKLCIKSCDC